jgi:hypothetical protein
MALEVLSAAVIPADCVSLTPQFLQKLSCGSICVPHRLQIINKASFASSFVKVTNTGRICQLSPSIELKLPSG